METPTATCPCDTEGNASAAKITNRTKHPLKRRGILKILPFLVSAQIDLRNARVRFPSPPYTTHFREKSCPWMWPVDFSFVRRTCPVGQASGERKRPERRGFRPFMSG